MIPGRVVATLVDVGGPMFANSVELGLVVIKTQISRRSAGTGEVLLLPRLASAREFSACAQKQENAVSAILERVVYQQVSGVFSPAAPPVPGALRALDGFYRRWKSMAPRAAPVQLGTYAQRSYRGRRLALYKAAEERVMREGLPKGAARVRAFIKHEKLPQGGKRVVPRIIQPRSPEFNVCIGRYMKHLEHDVYRLITRVFGGDPDTLADMVVTKGMNGLQVAACLQGKWERYARPRCLLLDASRFDQHIGPVMLRYEHRLWKCFYPGDREFAQLCKMQLRQKASLWVDDVHIQFISSTRCSGDMNTASGNCMIMCACSYGLLEGLGLVGRVSFFDNGDDCGFIGEDADIERLRQAVPAFFDALGIVMKVEPVVDRFEAISYCQTQPVFDGAQWVMVREVFASMSKDATILTPSLSESGHPSESSRGGKPDFLLALGKCGLALASGIPVVQSYYMALMRGREGRKAYSGSRLEDTGMWQLSRGMVARVREISPWARASFCAAFGIPPDAQVDIERQLDALDAVWYTGVTLAEAERATVFDRA